MCPLVIRADSIQQIGTGHIMRCIALGQAWKDQGGQVIFFSHCESIVLQQFIRDEGFELVEVKKKHPDAFDLVQLESYLQQCDKASEKTWVALDGYHFTLDYQKKIRNTGYRLMVIDDYNHLPEYYADVLLNQNIGAEQINYNCNSDCVKFLGYKYAMLRRDFRQCKVFKRKAPVKAKNILITMGGADPDNITLKVINALKKLNDPELDIRVIIGPSNPNRASLEDAIKDFKSEIVFVSPSPDKMPDLMAWSELAITAGGSTCWELCFMQVPTLVIITAKNQENICQALEKSGMARCLGWHNELMPDNVVIELKKVINDSEVRHQMLEKAKDSIDGKGLNRILRQLLIGELRLRPATINDREQLWNWVNDPLVRENSFSSGPISREEHTDWFKHKINDTFTIHYIVESNWSGVIGQIRFDIIDDVADIDYSIAAFYRGLGIGKYLVQKGIRKLKKDYHGSLIFQGRVKQQNMVSNQIFESLGFIKRISDQNGKKSCITWQNRL